MSKKRRPTTDAITVKATAPFSGQQLAVEQPVNVVIEKAN